MSVTIKHAKTNAIADWTQTQLDAIIAGGAAPLPPSGTTLSQVVLPSDWNDDHVLTGTIPAANLEAAGSSGQVQFNNAGTFGADSNFVWDNTNKRLGVGTATPTGVFHFSGVYGSLRYENVTNSNGITFYNSAGSSQLWIVGNTNGNTSDIGFFTSRLNIGNSSQLQVANSGGTTAVAVSASTVPFISRGAASQTTNLQEWQNSAGTAVAGITNNGDLFLNNISGSNTTARLSHTSGNSSVFSGWLNNTTQTIGIGFNVVGQYGGGTTGTNGRNLFVYDYVSGAYRFGIGPAGDFYYGDSNTSFSVRMLPSAASNVPLAVRAAVSQSANLQEWQNSAGTVLARIASNGQIGIDGGVGITSFNVASNEIRFSGGAGNIQLYVSGTSGVSVFGSGRIGLGSTHRITWHSNADGTGSGDTGLSRNAAGVVEINNGTAGTWCSLRVGAATAATVAQIIRGAASQTADLQQWQDSAGANLLRLTAAGDFQLGSRNIVNFINATNTTVFAVDSGGPVIPIQLIVGTGTRLVLSGDTIRRDGFAAMTLNNPVATAPSASIIGMTVRGAASQTANLQEWQNSGGTVLASINGVGNASFRTGFFQTTAGVSAHTVTVQANDAQGSGYLLRFLNNAGVLQSGFDGNGNLVMGALRSISVDSGLMGDPRQIITGGLAGLGFQTSGVMYFAAGGTQPNITIGTTGNLLINNFTASTVGITVRGATSQTANLQEWQNSGNTVLASITAAGFLNCIGADLGAGVLTDFRADNTTNANTTITIGSADTGRIIETTAATAVSVTLSATATVGTSVTVVQAAAGQCTFASTGSGTVRNRQSQFKTAGQWAIVTMYVRTNAGGSAAEWVLGGDTAA